MKYQIFMKRPKRTLLPPRNSTSDEYIHYWRPGRWLFAFCFEYPERKTFFGQAKYAYNLSRPVLQPPLFALMLKPYPVALNRRNVYAKSLHVRIRLSYIRPSFFSSFPSLFFSFLLFPSLFFYFLLFSSRAIIFQHRFADVQIAQSTEFTFLEVWLKLINWN